MDSNTTSSNQVKPNKHVLGPFTLGPGDDLKASGIYQGDMRSMCTKIPVNSVDFIFTDPPWDDESTYLYRELAKISSRVLKHDGFIMAYTGNDNYPWIVKAFEDEELFYFRTFAGIQQDSNTMYYKKALFVQWRPILVACKKRDIKPKHWTPDALKTTRDKRFHEWGQGEEAIDRWMRCFTDPGDIVLDPFCGGGSTAAVAKSCGRRWLTFDTSLKAVENATRHVNMAQPPLFVQRDDITPSYADPDTNIHIPFGLGGKEEL